MPDHCCILHHLAIRSANTDPLQVLWTSCGETMSVADYVRVTFFGVTHIHVTQDSYYLNFVDFLSPVSFSCSRNSSTESSASMLD